MNVSRRDVDQVHDMMDDIAEQQDLANEISNAISNPVGFGEDMDEDELAGELEKLEQEGLEEELLKVPGADELPSVPQGEVVKPKKTPASKENRVNGVVKLLIRFVFAEKVEDDDDMKELEAWAS